MRSSEEWVKVSERPDPRSPGQSAARLASKGAARGWAACTALACGPGGHNKLFDGAPSITVTLETSHNVCNELYLHLY